MEPSWFGFGFQVDNSDAQYASFRKNIPILLSVFCVHVLISSIISRIPFSFSSSQSANRDLGSRWTLTFSLLFLYGLFGASSLKVLIIISLHYWLIKTVGSHSQLAPICSWIFSIAILFLNDYYKGYQFGSFLSILRPLDEINGSGMRWNIIFNFTVLRMISFTMDQHWAQKEIDREISSLDCQIISNLSKRQRVEQPHQYDMYNFKNYITYCIYAPLYVAGPILSFNDFWHQMMHTPKTLTFRSAVTYTLRWLGVFLLMEFMMHFAHVVAIKDTKAWKGLFSPMEIFLVGFFNLKTIWLKVRVPFIGFNTVLIISC